MKNLLRHTLTIVAGGLALLLAQAGPSMACPMDGKDERTVTTADGATFHLKLKATPTVLPASGGTVSVTGQGYDARQGIFLAFCVIPDTVEVGDPATYTALPTSCLGGRESRDGSARRIVNGVTGTPGITIPYGPGGSFDTTLNLRPEIVTADGSTLRCDVTVKCAIVTRADYTATSNRLFDQYIPVRFQQ